MPATLSADKRKKLLMAVGIFMVPIVIILVVVFLLLPHTQHDTSQPAGPTAFNTKLPDPVLKKEQKNKLEEYMQAQLDSMKRKEDLRHDPYAAVSPVDNPPTGMPKDTSGSFSLRRPASGAVSPGTALDANERKVEEHLQMLYSAINKKGPGETDDKHPLGLPPLDRPQTDQVSRLQHLMENWKAGDTTPNPQLAQINAVLDKVLAIRHPQPPTAPSTPPAGSTAPTPVSAVAPDPIDPVSVVPQNGFYGLSEEDDTFSTSLHAMRAVVHESQSLVSGGIVKLRLLQDIFIGGVRIPANNFIYGPCSITGERVQIQLTSAIYNGQIYPIQLKVYDGTDGLEGLYVPGAITRDVVKESAGQAVTGLNPLSTLDQSLGAQAASAGIETARNLIGRKIRLVKATLQVGHIAILRNPDAR